MRSDGPVPMSIDRQFAQRVALSTWCPGCSLPLATNSKVRSFKAYTGDATAKERAKLTASHDWRTVHMLRSVSYALDTAYQGYN